MARTSSRRAPDVGAASTPGTESERAAAQARRLERRRGLPGGRAVAGGFLVAASAVGVFAAYLAATSGPDRSWVVASRDVTAGQQLAAADVRLVPLDLPAELRGRAFVDPEDVLGAVTTARLAEHDLVLATHLVDGTSTGHEQMSFPVDRARAVAGTIRAGDRIDVLASYRTGEETEVVASDVQVLDVEVTDGGLAAGGDLVLTVALEPGNDAVALAHAISRGELQLVRATGRDVE